MDWQQASVMIIVALTMGLFAWKGLRHSKADFHKQTGCGCGGAPKTPFVITGKKGELPVVVTKNS